MAVNYKVLGQALPAANTNTDIYTVPNGSQAVVSTLSVCATAANTQYRVFVRRGGAAANLSQYIVYNASVDATDTAMLTLGLTLSGNDVVSVYSSVANVAFNLFGSEIS